jgi:hypothetical protein
MPCYTSADLLPIRHEYQFQPRLLMLRELISTRRIALVSVGIVLTLATFAGVAAGKQERAESPYEWKVSDVEDRMTRQHHAEALLTQYPIPGSSERLEVKATCDQNGMDWMMGYFSGTNADAQLKLNYPQGGGGLVLGGVAGVTYGMMADIASAMRPSGPSVALRVRLDNNSPVIVPSYTQYNNAALLNFPPGSATDGTRLSTDRIGHDLNTLDQISHPRAATLEQIEAAGEVLVELPRDNGSPIYLTVKTQDAGFQQLISACSASTKQAGRDQIFIPAYMQQARTLMAQQPLPWLSLQSAYCLYEKVLKLDPNNQEASFGAMGAETRVRDRLEFGMTGPPITKLSCVSDTATGSGGGPAPGGTIEELKSKLPAILSAAASKYGLGPNGYSRELEYIDRYLDTCVLSDVPQGTQPPSVNDPKYEICQRQIAKEGFVGRSRDVSMAVNRPHNPFNPKVPGKLDVLLYNEQQANTPWQPGEKNTLTIAIFLPPNRPGYIDSSNFDNLISKADVKGRPSPDFVSSSTAANDSTATVRSRDVSGTPMTPEETAKIDEMQGKCNSGDGEKCFQLALKYRKGKEVPKDLDMARKYFQASCKLGHNVGCIQAQLLH